MEMCSKMASMREDQMNIQCIVVIIKLNKLSGAFSTHEFKILVETPERKTQCET